MPFRAVDATIAAYIYFPADAVLARVVAALARHTQNTIAVVHHLC